MIEPQVFFRAWPQNMDIKSIRFIAFEWFKLIVITDKHILTSDTINPIDIAIHQNAAQKEEAPYTVVRQGDLTLIAYYDAAKAQFVTYINPIYYVTNDIAKLDRFVHADNKQFVQDLLADSYPYTWLYGGLRIFMDDTIWTFDKDGRWPTLVMGSDDCAFNNSCILRCYDISHAFYNPEYRMLNYTASFDKQPTYQQLTLPPQFKLHDFGFNGARLMWFAFTNVKNGVLYCGWANTHRVPHRWCRLGKRDLQSVSDLHIVVHERYCIYMTLATGITAIKIDKKLDIAAPF